MTRWYFENDGYVMSSVLIFCSCVCALFGLCGLLYAIPELRAPIYSKRIIVLEGNNPAKRSGLEDRRCAQSTETQNTSAEGTGICAVFI